MRVRIRYDMPDENGETRRERARRFGQDEGPELEVPAIGFYLWGIYWSISSTLQRIREGVCIPIPPTEFLAWCEASNTFVSSGEYAILCDMDEAFCEETNKELSDYREREAERNKQDTATKPRPKPKRK